jgi:hypothetical protein
LNAAQSLKASPATQRHAAKGKLSCLRHVKLGYVRAARDHTLFQHKQALQRRIHFLIFLFLFIVVDASLAPGSAKSAPKSAGACTAATVFSV